MGAWPGVWPSTKPMDSTGGQTDSQGRPVQQIPFDPSRGWTADDVRAWYQRQRDLSRGGLTIQFTPHGTQYFALSTGSPVGAFLVRSDAVYKYPWAMYRSYCQDGPRAYEPVGQSYYGSGLDAFVGNQGVGRGGGISADEYAQLPEIDKAAIAMSSGDWKTATDNYRDHVALAPSDAGALRLLGVALILKGDMSEGVTAIALAYERDPSLAAQPIENDSPMSELEYRRAVSLAMHFAANVKTTEAYLAAAALKQGEGAPSVALKMLEKAKVAEGGNGLKSEIESELRSALEPRKSKGATGPSGQSR